MAKPPKAPLVDRELIHELTKLLDETGLTEIEIEQVEGGEVGPFRAGKFLYHQLHPLLIDLAASPACAFPPATTRRSRERFCGCSP